jgi:hypothetical protein
MATTDRAAEAKRLARARTLEMVAAGKLANVPESHPQRREMQRAMLNTSSKLRAAERAFKATR